MHTLTNDQLMAITVALLSSLQNDEEFERTIEEYSAYLAEDQNLQTTVQAMSDALGPNLAERIMRGEVKTRFSGVPDEQILPESRRDHAGEADNPAPDHQIAQHL